MGHVGRSVGERIACGECFSGTRLGGPLARLAGGGVPKLELGNEEVGTRQKQPPNRHPCQNRIRLAAKGFGENAGERKGLDAQKRRNHDEMVNMGYSG